MNALRYALAAVAASMAAASCTVEMELAGKRCPCTSEYECDTLHDVCVEEACAASASDFRLLWSTPHTIAARWVSTGDRNAFLKYEIVVAESQADLDGRTGTARIITDAERPELASYLDGESTTKTAIIEGLDANTIYFVALSVTDATSCTGTSDALQKRTAAEPMGIPVVLFDSWNPGDALPSVNENDGVTLEGAGDEAYAELILAGSICAGMEKSSICGQPVKINIDKVIGTTGDENLVTGQEFPASFLELTISYQPVDEADQLPGAHTGAVFLTPEHEVGNFRFDNFTIAPRDESQTLVFPLSALTASADLPEPGVPLDHSVLLRGPITQIGLGAQWVRAGRVRVERVQVLH